MEERLALQCDLAGGECVEAHGVGQLGGGGKQDPGAVGKPQLDGGAPGHDDGVRFDAEGRRVGGREGVRVEVFQPLRGGLAGDVAGGELLAERRCKSFEEAIDLCLDAIKKQIDKYKEKRR